MESIRYRKSPVEAHRPFSYHSNKRDDDDNDFETKIYHGFLRKVFGIVSTQLLATAIIVGSVIYYPSVGRLCLSRETLQMSAFVSLIVHLALVWNKDLAMRVPANYLLLGLFTVSDAITISASCYSTAKRVGTEVLFHALLLSFAVAVGLTILCIRSRKRVTIFRGASVIVSTGCLASLAFSFGSWMLGYRTPFQQLLASLLGAVVFGSALLIDIMLMVDGGQVRIREDHYIYAAIRLYSDFMRLFLEIMRLLSILSYNESSREDDRDRRDQRDRRRR